MKYGGGRINLSKKLRGVAFGGGVGNIMPSCLNTSDYLKEMGVTREITQLVKFLP